MDARDFIKKGREKKTPFVKWDENDGRYFGVILWTKIVRQFEFGTRNPKLDDDGNELMQMLLCIDGEGGKWIMPVREGSDLHEKLSEAVDKAGAESPEPGGFVDAKVIEKVTSGAVTYNRFAVEYEPPPAATGDDSPPF